MYPPPFIYSRAINCTLLAEEEQAERDCEINNYVNAILKKAFGD